MPTKREREGEMLLANNWGVSVGRDKILIIGRTRRRARTRALFFIEQLVLTSDTLGIENRASISAGKHNFDIRTELSKNICKHVGMSWMLSMH